MNVTELMAQIRTEMTGNPEKDILHLQNIATDLRNEENAPELLSAIAEFAFNMMPENARKQMIETTFVGGKRMDQAFGEAAELVNAGKMDEADEILTEISDKIAEHFEDKNPKWFSFRNPFEYHMYRFFYPDDTVFERAPFDFAKYLGLLGYVKLEKQDVVAAQVAIERAIKFNPVGADIRFELAEINKFAQNAQQLLRVNQETLPLCTSADRIAHVLSNMGFYCTLTGAFQDAAVFFFESIRFSRTKEVELELEDVLKRMKTFGQKFTPPTHGQTIDTYEKYGLDVPPNSNLVNLALTLASTARDHGRLDLQGMFLRTALDLTNDAGIRAQLEQVAGEIKEARENGEL